MVDPAELLIVRIICQPEDAKLHMIIIVANLVQYAFESMGWAVAWLVATSLAAPAFCVPLRKIPGCRSAERTLCAVSQQPWPLTAQPSKEGKKRQQQQQGINQAINQSIKQAIKQSKQ